MSGRSMRPFL